jgi:hypothetical protein
MSNSSCVGIIGWAPSFVVESVSQAFVHCMQFSIALPLENAAVKPPLNTSMVATESTASTIYPQNCTASILLLSQFSSPLIYVIFKPF